MTILAETPPPLRRLFDRLDFAPQPKRETLIRLLSQWTKKRGSALAPHPEDFSFVTTDDEESSVAFTFTIGPGENEYVLTSGGRALGPLLGPFPSGTNLKDASNARNAVRLRRLFEAVRQQGEPVLAEFGLSEHGREVAVVEVLAAPLSETTRTVDALLGGVSIRPAGGLSGLSRHVAGTRPDESIAIFALGPSRAFGERVARSMGASLSLLEERVFEDGEHKTRPLVNVRGRDVHVIHSLFGEPKQSANDKLLQLLFFVGALKDAGAARVTAVVPYLCYSRKDRQTKPRDPITSRYVAQVLESVGTDRVVTMDVHNLAAFQNAFRCDTDHLEAAGLLVSHLTPRLGQEPVAVVSPDLGGAKRAEAFRERLEARLGRQVEKGFMDKQRSMGRVTGEIFAGDVAGRTVIVVDDLIATGTTMARVAASCRARGARHVIVFATHGLFTGGAEELWREAAIDEVVVTNTVEAQRPVPQSAGARLTVLDVAPLFGEAIARCHEGGSIAELMAP